MPSKKPTRVAKTVPAKRPLRVTGAIGPKWTAILVVCVMAGGILVAARQQSQPRLTATPRLEPVAMPDAPAKTMAAAIARDVPASAPESSSAKTAAVTVTGCLEQDGDSFRLKNASGADAPKARSWKSGFLKKGPAAIAVVDAAHTLNLAAQVGRRVSVTGALDGREMSARSLRRLAASCSAQ